MLGKFFDKFCFTALFLVAAVLILAGVQLSSVFSAHEGGKMTGKNPVPPKTVGLWKRPDSPKLVTSDDIFDYMNGAGELYLGYRFDHLDVFEYEAESQKGILAELYHMKTSDDAYGLLSLDWGGEAVNLATDSPDDAGGRLPWPRALYGQGLLRLWTQNIYARVMATQETPESREAVLAIGRAIVQGRKNSPAPALSERLKDQISPGWTLQKAKLSFFRTHLVLNSLYYLSHENILGLDLECEVLKGEYEKSDSPEGKLRIQVILVSYPDGIKAKRALSRFHEAYLADIPFSPETGRSGEKRGVFSVEDGWMGYGLNDASIAFVFESPDENTARAILDQMHANIK